MLFNKYTAEVADWATAIELVVAVPQGGTRIDELTVGAYAKFLIAVISTPEGHRAPWIDAQVKLQGSVVDVEIGGFNVLRIRGITNHRIQIYNTTPFSLPCCASREFQHAKS
jgi:hypothetical protein